MKRASLFGLMALLPAALNTPAAAGASILMPMCTGDGQVHMVRLPLGGKQPPGGDSGCCIKGCHAGSNRKKLLKEIEPAQ